MKKGFTLVELLAVIVILALIALITVPVVTNIISSSKDETYEMSVKNYARAVETSLYRNDLTSATIANGTYQINSNGNICLDTTCTKILEVDTDGEKPTGGTIQIQDNEVISITQLTYNSFIAYMNSDEKIAIIKEGEKATCKLEADDGVVSVGDIVTCLTESFYVMSSDETSTTMFSMYNLNIGNAFTYNSDDDMTLVALTNPTGMQSSLTVGCNAGTYCADYENMLGSTFYGVLSQETAITAITDYGTKLRTLLGITTESDLTTSMTTGTQLTNLGCDGDTCTYSWVYNTSYWVNDDMNTMEYTGFWYNDSDYFGIFNLTKVADDVSYTYGDDGALLFGARPVVTISNEYIK